VSPLQQQLAAAADERQRAQQRAADLQRELEAARAAAEQERARLGGDAAALGSQLDEALGNAARVRFFLIHLDTSAAARRLPQFHPSFFFLQSSCQLIQSACMPCLHLLQLEQQLAAAGQDRARWEERASELQRELEAARAAARQEQERLEGRAAQLAGELEAARAAAAQVPPLQDRLAAAGEERRRLEARAAELEGQLGSVRAAAESEQARLGGELAALRTQLEQARAEAARVSPCPCGAETLAALLS
jgi:chromosome segregation ATPase